MANAIEVRISGDASHLKRVLDDAEGRLGRFGSAVGTGMRTAGLALGGLGVAAVVAAPKVLEMGAGLEALAAKSKTVFEDSLGTVETWARANAGALGMTAAQLVGVAAGTADLLKPMGFAADAAASMAMETNDLAGALSAWTGGERSAAEVSEILTKAYLGERDGLKALGISISEAELSARLLQKGQQDLTGAALQQAQAIATQELIMEKSTDAQKAWTDGSMDSVRAQNESKASIERVKEGLVQSLFPVIQAALPLIESLATWMGEHLPRAIDKVKAWFEENWPKIQASAETVITWFNNDAKPVIEAVVAAMVVAFDKIKAWTDEHWPEIKATIESTINIIKTVIEATVAVIQELWSRFGENLVQVISGAMDVIKGVIQTVTAIIRGDWGTAWDGIKAIVFGVWEMIKGIVGLGINQIKALMDLAWAGIKAGVSSAWEGIKAGVSEGLDAIVGAVMALPGRVATQAANAFESVWQSFKNVMNRIIDGWNSLSFSLPSVDTHIPGVGTVGGWSIDTPNIRRFHSGGLVQGPIGSDVLALLTPGERVFSREQMQRIQGTGENGPELLLTSNGGHR